MVIRVQEISKHFKTVQALKNISFQVAEGEVFGLIGPDGAGKTTLIRIMATLLKQDAGNITLAGYNNIEDYEQVRNLIGYVPGKFSLYQDLTVEENLNLFATIFGTTLQENYYLIKDIYQMLEPFKKRRAGNLSGGMKQKLALSCALIHKPKILLLDEPTTGVDPVSRKEFWEMLGRLKNEGITILVATPYMDEAAKCDRVGLIQTGNILSIDTPQNIITGFPLKIYSVRSLKRVELLHHLRDMPNAHSANLFGDSIHYIQKMPEPDELTLEAALKQAGYLDAKVERIQPVIEDCFIELMKSQIAA